MTFRRFATSVDWCWAHNTNRGLDHNVLVTLGITSNLAPGGILNDPAATLVATGTGLAETSANVGGIPCFTTSNGVGNYAILVNPLATSPTLTLQLSMPPALRGAPPCPAFSSAEMWTSSQFLNALALCCITGAIA